MLRVLEKGKKFLACFVMALTVISTSIGASVLYSVPVHASGIEDNVGSGSSSESNASSEDQAVADLLQGFRPMGSEELSTASQALSPVVSIIGNIVGGIVVLVMAAVFLITAADLLYITFPPIRNVLYKGGAAGGMQAPMGSGMMGGYGGRYGGMMGGGMVSMNQGMAQEAKPMQIISDEAVQCVAMLNNGGAQPQVMGGGMMGGMQPMPAGQNMSMKSVILMYFKKRAFFMILLAVCVIVLTSSVLLDTGINLAQWFVKLMETINSNIPT